MCVCVCVCVCLCVPVCACVCVCVLTRCHLKAHASDLTGARQACLGKAQQCARLRALINAELSKAEMTLDDAFTQGVFMCV